MNRIKCYMDILRLSDRAFYIELGYQDIMKEIICESLSKQQSMDTPYLLTLEKNFLTLASYPDCVSGIIYAMPLLLDIGDNSKILYVRCFESGVFEGFFKAEGEKLLGPLVAESPVLDIVYTKIYVDWDVNATYRNDEKLLKRNPQHGKIFNNIVRNYKGSINNTLPIAYTQLKNVMGRSLFGYMVYIQRNSSNSRSKDLNALNYFNLNCLGDTAPWESSIKSYMTSGLKTHDTIARCVSVYENRSALTLREQFDVISCLPNYHHWLSTRSHGVKMEEYFLKHGKSPRSQIMREIIEPEDEFCEDTIITVMQIFCSNKFHLYNIDSIKTSKKRRIQRKRKTPKPRLNAADILSVLGMNDEDLVTLQTEDNLSCTLYENFKTNISLCGCLKWRVISSSVHKVLMNDYNSETGDFKQNDFVITSQIKHQDDSVTLCCTCETYKVILSTVTLHYNESDWSGLKCCHCRLLTELVEQITYKTDLNEHSYSYLDTIAAPEPVRSALECSAVNVIEAPAKSKDVLKYSCVVGEDVEFVHLFKSNGSDTLFVSCQSGLCQHSFGKKRSVKRLNENDQICKHMKLWKEWYSLHSESLDQVLASESDGEFENGNGDNDDDGDVGDNGDNGVFPDENDEHEELTGVLEESKWLNCFDVASGMWCFPSSYGRDVCRDKTNSAFVKQCSNRLHITSEYLSNVPEYEPVKLFPIPTNDLCGCEVAWPSDENGDNCFTLECQSILYTKIAAVPCLIYKLQCQTKQCCLLYKGENEFLFRKSSAVCIAEELFWDFIQMVTTMKCNFSAFCSMMKSTYQQHLLNTNGFLSSKTFSSAFFSWASYQKIDFRMACEWCGEAPPILACDATKIGIAFRNCQISPIEKPAREDAINTPHRRFKRCFLSEASCNMNGMSVKDGEVLLRDSRKHMKLIMSSANGFRLQKDISQAELVLKNNNLLRIFPEACKPLLQNLLSMDMTMEQTKYMTKVFHMLSYDAPLRSFIPFIYLSSVKEMLCKVSTGAVLQPGDIIDLFLKFNPLLGNFVLSFYNNNTFIRDALAFLNHLVEQIEKIHETDVIALESSPIPGTYNPPRLGRAYYFTAHGQQIRPIRKFSIDVKSAPKATHDDTPLNSKCSKRYPVVAMKGSTFLFLWFCPLHGHCYGHHIVSGSEGRKDPCSSLLTHLPEAPGTIFYDFACSLEEYCLNRESGYYKNTRFFHDVFHGFSHTCSSVYSSRRLIDYQSVNSSLCEQFNSYLQCIKSSAKHMSQVRFMFYTQFMIHIWNQRKNESFKKKLKIAASG